MNSFLPTKKHVSRHTDIEYEKTFAEETSLPPVDWKSIGQSPPVPIAIDERKSEDPLPRADIVILTWTSAEWFALDHIFLNSEKIENSDNKDWRKEWNHYTRDTSGYSADKKSGELWGCFRMVQITDLSGKQWNVLLFKSNSHLAHPPWIKGLSKMLQCIFEDTKTNRIYTIGTAGGARLDQYLGDSIVTNSAHLKLQRPENTSDPDNGETFRCPTWFPSNRLIENVEKSLLYKMNQIVTHDHLNKLLKELQDKLKDHPEVNKLELKDLVNDPVKPELLGNPKVRIMKDVPLLTTDYYYVAKGHNSDEYSFLEMDDAVIAREANRANVVFACLRNVSDPVVSDATHDGKPISDDVRDEWSALIYSNFGLLTSYNSALATWATIAGEGT